MRILLADLAPNTPGSGGVLAALAAALRERRHEPVLRHAADLAPVSSILAVAETSPLAFRYSGGGAECDPAIIVIATGALTHLPGMLSLAEDPALAAFIVREETGKAVPLYAPAGKLLPSQRLEAHLRLPNRPLADRAELLWLLSALHEFVLTALGPAEFLRHLLWRPNIRLREETFGGLLFVPETSQVIQFDREGFEAVQRAVALNSPRTLAEDLVADPLTVIGALSAAGALTAPASECQP